MQTMPSHVIRTVPIPHKLHRSHLARENQLHRCVPFVDAVTWIHALCCEFQCVHGFIVPWFYCPLVRTTMVWCEGIINSPLGY